MLNEWKDRLGLHGWVIRVCDNLKPDEMRLADSWGDTLIDPVNKAARIDIINPEYVCPRLIPFDYEKVLVHELLHIKFCLIEHNLGNIGGELFHQMIDELAVAFVDAKRNERHHQTTE